MSDTLSHPMIDKFVSHLKASGKSEHTVRAYRRNLEGFATWTKHPSGEEFDPAKVIPADIKPYETYLRVTRRQAQSTINQKITRLKTFFGWLHTKGKIQTVPTAETTVKKPSDLHPKSLDELEYRQLKREAAKESNLRDIALIELMLGTGACATQSP